ncbi:helix-turn-helix transcriptional regulator [Actinoallomurus purpureus]|uniref:helix-turn-helix domain-containing protein n=1 Tax=Actinoallomurus purpureus TaxID=478114 RepID=UPI00209390C2|nr:helix-turn-helix transcriptional regulator [Actinoallomurus purpureus]MCO6009874.1 helix-turn-helix transcriptional regulator [Actinoallomurus purpureus]
MREEQSAGGRIATFRKLRGWSQRKLADRAGVSYSLLTKVEAGHKPATPALISATARALDLDVSQITGQPYAPDTPTDEEVFQHIAVLRRELSAYDLPPTHDGQPKPLPYLRAAVSELAQLRHGVNLLKLGEKLPSVLQDLRLAAHVLQNNEREQIYGLLAETYAAAGQLAYKMGYTDLSSISTDRYQWAAAQSGDALAIHIGEYLRAGELMVAGDLSSAAALMDASLGRLEPQLADRRGDGWERSWAVWGNLHLKAALVVARSGRPDAKLSTWQHFEQAKDAADQIGYDRDDYRLFFGPTNVDIWSVGLAVELCDDAVAIEKAKRINLSDEAPKERRSHHFIDLARAHVWRNDPEGALRCLFQARDISPQHTRFHPQVRETTHALGRLERRSTASLRSFARWLGMDD